MKRIKFWIGWWRRKIRAVMLSRTSKDNVWSIWSKNPVRWLFTFVSFYYTHSEVYEEFINCFHFFVIVINCELYARRIIENLMMQMMMIGGACITATIYTKYKLIFNFYHKYKKKKHWYIAKTQHASKGNKTLCDYCNSKAAKKARKKEHREATPTPVEAASEHISIDEQSHPTTVPSPPTTSPHAQEEGINRIMTPNKKNTKT